MTDIASAGNFFLLKARQKIGRRRSAAHSGTMEETIAEPTCPKPSTELIGLLREQYGSHSSLQGIKQRSFEAFGVTVPDAPWQLTDDEATGSEGCICCPWCQYMT